MPVFLLWKNDSKKPALFEIPSTHYFLGGFEKSLLVSNARYSGYAVISGNALKKVMRGLKSLCTNGLRVFS